MSTKKIEDYKRFGIGNVTIRECGCVYLDNNTRLEEPCNEHCDMKKEKEKKNKELTKNIKEKLQESDYKAFKYLERYITEEEYVPIKAERQSLRDQINEIENKINACTTIEELQAVEV